MQSRGEKEGRKQQMTEKKKRKKKPRNKKSQTDGQKKPFLEESSSAPGDRQHARKRTGQAATANKVNYNV